MEPEDAKSSSKYNSGLSGVLERLFILFLFCFSLSFSVFCHMTLLSGSGKAWWFALMGAEVADTIVLCFVTAALVRLSGSKGRFWRLHMRLGKKIVILILACMAVPLIWGVLMTVVFLWQLLQQFFTWLFA